MKKYNVIIFDLDSTLVKIEGLDWLAYKNGRFDQVSKLTRQSMDGSLSINSALVEKMRLISPSYEDMLRLGKEYCENIVEDCVETINALQSLGKEVWMITGNFQPAVGVLAKKLGIPSNRVVCNKIDFDNQGNYVDFDYKSPLAKNGGKAEVVRKLFPNKKETVFVGDGSTDLETQQVVDLFIGYCGVVERDLIKKNADFYISCESLSPLLLMLLSEKEKREINSLDLQDLLIKSQSLLSSVGSKSPHRVSG